MEHTEEINWDKEIPRWVGEQAEPPESKKTAGFEVGDKPPALWENWFRNKVYESVKENRENINIVNLAKTDKTYVDGKLGLKVDKVAGKGLSTNDFTNAYKIEVDKVASKADTTALTAHKIDKTNPHNVTKAQVGLNNVNNTADMNKPVSHSMQTALDKKANITLLDAHKNNKLNPHAVTKAQVGLGNVDNTADIDKPISTAVQKALDTKLDVDTDMQLENILNTVYPVGAIYTSVVDVNPNQLFGVGAWTRFGAGRVLAGVDTTQEEFNIVEKEGGAKTEVLTIAQMPRHTHSVSVNSGGAHAHSASSATTGGHIHEGSTSSTGSHTHTASSGNAGTHSHSASSADAGIHKHTGITDDAGRHNHGYYFLERRHNVGYWMKEGTGVTGLANPYTTDFAGSHKHTLSINDAGSHSHTISVGSAGSHNHSISIGSRGTHSHSFDMESAGSHRHTITVSSAGSHAHSASAGYSGNGEAHNNLQPYITVFMWKRTA